MDLSPFVSADPATRPDGWSPERKLRFLDRLAGCGNVRSACAAVGLSREAAYTLRRRDALFARGWAAALVLARESSIEVLADKATEGIEEEVWYRGERGGTRRRFDARLLLAHLARLDRMVEEADGGAVEDAARFDELLACIAGAQAPEELAIDDEPLPLDRESALLMAADAARDAAEAVCDERDAESESGGLSREEYFARWREIEAEAANARAKMGGRWDAWFGRACETVDERLGTRDVPAAEPAAEPAPAESSPRTGSEVSSSSPAAVSEGLDGRLYARP